MCFCENFRTFAIRRRVAKNKKTKAMCFLWTCIAVPPFCEPIFYFESQLDFA
jgi:hypothetical protein